MFTTKAQTLLILRETLKSADILNGVICTSQEWIAAPSEILRKISECIKGDKFIVRSSATSEDQVDKSNAGAFLSLLNITFDNLDLAIERVFQSYKKLAADDEVLIQPMLQNVVRSGVAFSHDPSTGAPYRIVNWHDGDDTTYVTSGRGGRRWIQAAGNRSTPPNGIDRVINLVDEILTITRHVAVDIEFAVTRDERNGEKLWLLQARPLYLANKSEDTELQTKRIEEIETKIKSRFGAHPFLFGSKTVFGIMPDWNPAEMLGIRPRPLALTLYRDLITDSTWAYQRHNYGYKNLRSFPLMVSIYGQPYVDVRVSFNSFIPADIDGNLATKLVDFYINKLLEKPTLHDKVEFEIVYSCITLNMDEKIKELKNNGFSDEEIIKLSKSLIKITNNIINPRDGLLQKDIERLSILEERRRKILDSSEGEIEKIYWLLEDARRYGTLPFAGLARAGFIAIQILNSIRELEIFSDEDYSNFMSSIQTIGKELVNDRASMKREEFFKKYGHLRPGTYDILSPRYDESPELFFDWEGGDETTSKNVTFDITSKQKEQIDDILTRSGLDIDADELMNFIRSGIKYRELSKFLFTKNLSDALSRYAEYSSKYGFTKEEIAYSSISVVKELYVSCINPRETIAKSIDAGKEIYRNTEKISLPPLISDERELWGFELHESEPNFITQKCIMGELRGVSDKEKLTGSIILLPNADPGYDWIFSHSIAGLITGWGGANSHMAIRAGELDLPAAIGIGELKYSQLSAVNKVFLDCAGRRIDVVI